MTHGRKDVGRRLSAGDRHRTRRMNCQRVRTTGGGCWFQRRATSSQASINKECAVCRAQQDGILPRRRTYRIAFTKRATEYWASRKRAGQGRDRIHWVILVAWMPSDCVRRVLVAWPRRAGVCCIAARQDAEYAELNYKALTPN